MWDFCWVCFLLSWFPALWASYHFCCAGFSSRSASTERAFTELGFCWAWPPPRTCWAEVVTARLNPRNGTIDVRGVCNFLSSVLPQQKFEALDRPVLKLSFFWQAKENTSLRWEDGTTQKTQREKSPEAQFWLLFLYVFSPPLELPYVNWASQEGCFTWGSHSSPYICLCSIFVDFSLLCLLATSILDSFFLF